ncbi:hypothetical protein, partial [Streptomyces coelicoflavus]|uniref:hypothetical protein n=1 Tax=Streptomyces coelicoflavus TaxID=285562 RepID=UPI0019440E6F
MTPILAERICPHFVAPVLLKRCPWREIYRESYIDNATFANPVASRQRENLKKVDKAIQLAKEQYRDQQASKKLPLLINHD